MGHKHAWVVGIVFAAIGCTTFPMVVAVSGQDTVPLNTRLEVHDALGSPIAQGKVDEGAYEDFRVKNGCDQLVWGQRVPAFHPLDEFHVHGSAEVQLIAGKDANIPAAGKNLVVVAQVNNLLQVCIFDADGKTSLRTDEVQLPPTAVAELRKQLEPLWPPHALVNEEKEAVIMAVAKAVCHTPPGSFELALSTAKSNLLQKAFDPRDATSRHPVQSGQVLRFVYDRHGQVKKVYLDGECVLSRDSGSQTIASSSTPPTQVP